MRHIVNSSEVAHLWAHKSQTWAQNAKHSVFFRDSTIYSYGEHFPIARHVLNLKGEAAVLFTTASYSVTTSGHCSMVWSACHHLHPFHVPNVYAGTPGEHDRNLADYGKRIASILLKAARARNTREWHHKEALELREEAVRYAKFFAIPYSSVLPKVEPLASGQLEALKEAESKRLAAERKRTLEENREAIAQWRKGEYVRLAHGLPDMLRVSADGLSIETSRGASFPISHAKRGLALVRAVRERGQAWQTNGHICALGNYRIDSIQADGTVKAGCHTVKYSEIERVAPAIDACASVLETLDKLGATPASERVI